MEDATLLTITVSNSVYESESDLQYIAFMKRIISEIWKTLHDIDNER